MTDIQAERARRSNSSQASTTIDGSKERCRTLYGFIKESWHVVLPAIVYIDNWHIQLIADHLEAITLGKMLDKGYQNRLACNIPPGGMKSLLVSVFWTAWEWGPAGMPHLQSIATSYREDFVYRDIRRLRTLIDSDWYLARWPDAALKTRAQGRLENHKGGWREAYPFKSLTGGRCDRLIIDDPHSVNTAESDAERNSAELTFRESAQTRMNDPVRSAIVLIMQRLHENDLCGVIDKAGMKFVKVVIPMRFDPQRRCETPWGYDPRKKAGEMYWPARFPKLTVDQLESDMGSYATASQDQQLPGPRGGLMFKRIWFPIVGAAPLGVQWVRGWDLAGTKASMTTASGPAYTAGVKMGRDYTGRFYIGHVIRLRESPAMVERAIRNTAALDGTGTMVDLPQDPGQAGKGQAASLVGQLAGYMAYASTESGDKIDRARPVSAQAEAGNISVIQGDWNESFFDEVEKFPTGTYKDQVDAMSRAFSRLVMQPGGTIAGPLILTGERTAYGDHQGGG